MLRFFGTPCIGIDPIPIQIPGIGGTLVRSYIPLIEDRMNYIGQTQGKIMYNKTILFVFTAIYKLFVFVLLKN